MALSLPRIQNRLVQEVQKILQRQLGVVVQVEQVDVSLPSKVVLRGLSMEDDRGEEFISINELKLDILSLSLLQWARGEVELGELYIRYIELDAVDFHLVKRSDSVFNIDFLKGDAQDSTRSPLLLGIEFPEVNLKNCRFHYRDDTHPDVQRFAPGTINFRNFHVKGIYGNIDFSYAPDSLTTHVKRLRAIEERTGFQLEDFHALLSSDPSGNSKGVFFRDVLLTHQRTQIAGEWEFEDFTLAEVFEDWVDIPSRFILEKSSLIDLSTIEYLSSEPLPVQGIYGISGTITGTLDRWKSEDLFIRYKDSTYSNVWIEMRGLGEEETTTFDIRIKDALMLTKHVEQIVPEIKLPFNEQAFSQTKIVGSIQGQAKEFVMDLRCLTP